MLDQYQGGWRGSGDLKVKYSAQADNALLLQNYDVDKMMWFQSMRDFSYGTLIETDIPYNVTSGDIWFLEIKGNPYTSNASFDIKVHAYIYYDTLIYVGGLSNGSALSDLVAICHNNHLCFWFSTQSYFQGFEIFCAAANAQGKYANRVISVTDVDKPTTYKEVNLWAAMTQSLTTANYTSYTVGKDGTGASGTWNITAQNAHTVDGYHANELICKGASGHYEPATWIKLGITGLYSSTNGAYLYPNDGTYGSWKIQGTKGGWSGIEFDSGNVLMMNAAESGFYNVNYGWQIHWSAGSLYCNKGASGGGTQATVLDTSNYGSLISALSQTITATDFILGSSDKDRKSNIKPLMDTEGNIARPMVDYYSFNLDSKDRKRYGALYQDVQPLYPELAGEVDGKKGLAYIDLLIWETAYNKNRVDLLEKEVSRLKGRVAYLEGRAI
jgi:hypothetical protein